MVFTRHLRLAPGANEALESDHKPARSRAEDRLDAKKPKNQGKNISRFSHGFFSLHY